MSTNQRQRQERQRESLQKRWDLLQKKLQAFQRDYDLETRTEEQLRFKNLISKTKSEIQDVEQELLQLEELLSAGPEYPDAETRARSRALEDAYERRAELETRGESPLELDETIAGLKCRQREDGRLKAGDLLMGRRFQLNRLIGQGGFAQVFKAYDRTLRKVVAVKVLHTQYGHDRSRRQRFFRGARQMARLRDHPGVVDVLEEKCQDGAYRFFVMEYVGGGDFRQAVCAGRLSRDKRLDTVLEVGETLRAAHQRGIVHRDVKPANILLDFADCPKLTDFDLVRATDTTGGTRTSMLGTFLYAAPEAMSDAKQAAEPADVYGLGMTVLFALYGKDLPPVVMRKLPQFLASLDVPDSVRPVLERSVEWEVEDRWKTVGDFCDAMRDSLGPIEEIPQSVKEASRRTAGATSNPQTLPAHCERAQQLTGIELVYIPGGRYRLGSEDLDHSSKPVHRVHLSPFWIGRTAVTNAQYGRFLAENKDRPNPDYWDDSKLNDPQQPVVGVSWLGALAFSRWAGFDLQTEAEWEAAARGTDECRFPWGNDEPDAQRAHFDSDRPAKVGSNPFGVGPFGTLDQAGNVWEWCWDEFDKNAYRHRDGKRDPVIRGDEGDENALRVLRGGSWGDPARFLLAAFRSGSWAWFRNWYLGFRVVCRFGPEHGD